MAGNNDTGFWQKAKEVLGAIRQWLRDHGFAELAKFNDADLIGITPSLKWPEDPLLLK